MITLSASSVSDSERTDCRKVDGHTSDGVLVNDVDEIMVTLLFWMLVLYVNLMPFETSSLSDLQRIALLTKAALELSDIVLRVLMIRLLL